MYDTFSLEYSSCGMKKSAKKVWKNSQFYCRNFTKLWLSPGASCLALSACLKRRKERHVLLIRTTFNTTTTTLLLSTTGSAPTRAVMHASQRKRNLTCWSEMIYLSMNTATKLWKGLFETRKTKLSNGWLWFLEQLLNQFSQEGRPKIFYNMSISRT